MNRTELLSLGTRVAGGILAFGYLLGLVPGSVVAITGAVALMTFGRAVFLATREAVLAAAGAALIGAASGISALRWGTLDLGAIRGAQAVLGPTVLVAPAEASLAAWLAAGAGVVALSAWVFPALAERSRPATAWAPDALVGALVLVSVFWGPAFVVGAPEGFVAEAGRWALAVLVVGALSATLAVAFDKLGGIARTSALVLATAAVVAAGELMLRAV